MYKFKHDVVNDLIDEERFDLITDGLLREPIFDFGTELVTGDDLIYECEYMTEAKTLKESRMLWCITKKNEKFNILPEDPALEEHDDSYRDEHYIEIKARVEKGDYPDLSELISPEEFMLVMPKLLEDGIIKFNRESGEYSLDEDVQVAINKKISKLDKVD